MAGDELSEDRARSIQAESEARHDRDIATFGRLLAGFAQSDRPALVPADGDQRRPTSDISSFLDEILAELEDPVWGWPDSLVCWSRRHSGQGKREGVIMEALLGETSSRLIADAKRWRAERDAT